MAVRMNRTGMGELLHSPGLRADLLRRAQRGADAARASAPVESGAYRDGIEATTVVTDRVVGRIVARAPHSPLVEARTGNLARALDSAR